jgi:hypothetical protein
VIKFGECLLPCISEFLSSHLLSGNIKIAMYKMVIALVVLCGYETWSLTLMEEHRIRIFENSVLMCRV